MKVYEGMFLWRTGDINHLDIVRGIIEKRKGVVKEIDKWDERRLSYEIDRNKRGFYVLAYFEAPQEAVAQIKRDCVLSEDVLRVLILRALTYEKKEELATASKEETPAEGPPGSAPEGKEDQPRQDAESQDVSDKITG